MTMSWSRVAGSAGTASPGCGGVGLPHSRSSARWGTDPSHAASQGHGHSGKGSAGRRPDLDPGIRRHGRGGRARDLSHDRPDRPDDAGRQRDRPRALQELRLAARLVRRPRSRPGRPLGLGRAEHTDDGRGPGRTRVAGLRPFRLRCGQGGGQRGHRHEHPGGGRRRARRRQDRRADRRTAPGRSGSGRHRRHRQRAARDRELAAARRGVRRRAAPGRRPRAAEQRRADDGQARASCPREADRTELYDIDLSDPANPHLAQTSTAAGHQVSMRQYGDTVRLVTSAGLPALPFGSRRAP